MISVLDAFSVFYYNTSRIRIGDARDPVFMFGLGLGVSGAGRYERVKKRARFTVTAGTLALTVLGIILFIFAEPVITWFRDDPEVIEIGTAALRWQCISAIFMSASVTGNMLFQSIGKAKQAFFLASLRTGLFYFPLILLLPRLMGVTGIELAQPISDVLSAVVSVILAGRFLHRLGTDN